MVSLRIAILLALLTSAPALAAEPGDASAGQTFARKVCAECHAVDAGEQKSPNPDAPTFQAVAATPGMTGRALAVWLQSSHPTMPNIVLSREDRDNIIAHIMSLAEPAAPPDK